MVFEYNKLKGLIKEKGFTQHKIALHLEISDGTFSQKINGIACFTQPEIFKLVKLLEISEEKIFLYFFTLKV